MKKGYIKCPFCANEVKKGAIKCSFCEEFLDGRPKENKEEKTNIIYKKDNNYIIITIVIILFLIILGLILWILNGKKEQWQGIYYPEGLTHADGEQIYGPIFDNYKACEDRGLYQLREDLRDSMCISQCQGTNAGLPTCDKVIRSRKPFSTSEVFEGAEEIRERIIAKIEEEKEQERLRIEEAEKKAEEERKFEEERQNKIREQALAEQKKLCDEFKAEANRQIAEIEKSKSNTFCNNLENSYTKIKDLENKVKNAKKEAKEMYKGDVPSYMVDATAANLSKKYQDEIDSTYWMISNYSINECNLEKQNNRRFDELILQWKQAVKEKGCSL